MDKRPFYAILTGIMNEFPDSATIVESVKAGFDEVPPITEKEIRALKQYPLQFVKRIAIEDEHGEWTTQLHIWAENGVSAILDLDPMFLGFKNSHGDSVLMCLTVGASGTHTGKIDYDLIKKIMDRDYSYEEKVKNDNGDDELVTKNAIDETDINGKTPIQYLAEIAYGKGEYEGDEPDMVLQQILTGDVPTEEGFEEPDSTILNSEPNSDQP